MAQTRTCDSCGHLNDDRSFYSPGWGALTGTDSLGQQVTKDLCPRCSAMLQVMLGELRRRFTTTSVPIPAPTPAPSTPSPGAASPAGLRAPALPLSSSSGSSGGSAGPRGGRK
jgi:hypothetical protein